MRGLLLAVAVLATIAISLAADEVCVQRKLRGLPVHWPNPTDCSSFYRCTNKNVKRELLCPEGKEYNPKTGRCGSKGKNLCKLSLIAPLADSNNPCADEISGTFVADPKSCRGFNICNNNVAYPQTCDIGSYFNTEISACEPDTEAVCWENLCVKKADGLYVPRADDCHSFYVCYEERPVLQNCPEGSYFNVEDLNCQPGKCPSDENNTTTDAPETKPTTTETPETGTPSTEETTTCTPESVITNTGAPVTTTTPCTGKTTTTTTPCTAETSTTTTCTSQITTTTSCEPETTTPVPDTTTTTTCAAETNTPHTEETTTTTPCAAETTTTTCEPETTTLVPDTTTPCTAETTTLVKDTTTCAAGDITTTLSSTTDEDCSDLKCDPSKCENAKDGFIYPALNTNAGFCVCQQQKPKYRECSDNAIFNESLKICVTQDSVCPSTKCLNQSDHSTFPAGNTTAGFCKCLEGEATYHDCAETDYVFNDQLGFCVKSNDCGENNTTNTITSSRDCKGGFKEGDFLPNPDNCMLLYICYDGEFVDVSCGTGNYYDDTIKACLPDHEGKCPDCHVPSNAISSSKRNKRNAFYSTKCPEGVKTKAVDCNKFYKCIDGHKLLYGCTRNHFFNVTTLSCQYDTDLTCEFTSKCKDGELTPNPHYCEKYYECVNAKQVERSCLFMEYFNKETLTCENDINNVCWDKEPCLCPGGYKEGDISPHPQDCDKFYICTDGKQVINKCGEGNFFNNITMACEKDVNNICVKPCLCPGGYKEGEFSAHPKDCDKYYICEKGKQMLFKCGEGNYFDNNTLSCERDVYNECWPKSEECTCPGGYKEGDITAHPKDCNKFYICHDSHQILKDCGLNNYFNNYTLQCEPDTYHVCWPNLCDGVEGQIANPKQCNAYYNCENGIATPGVCDEGEMFSTKHKTCVLDLNAECYNPCANVTVNEIRLLPHPICTDYYLCNGDIAYVNKCDRGGFDPETGICDEKKICPVISYENFPHDNIIYLADPYNPRLFSISESGKLLKWVTCPTDHEFDADFKICRKTSENGCPTCTEDGSFPSLDDDDSSYCICVDNVATKMKCPNEYVYNPEMGTCYSNAPCDPNFCLYAKDNEVYPNRNDTKSFCMCIQKKPIIINCPNGGTFNPYLLTCSQYEMSPECSQAKCLGDKLEKGVFAPVDIKKFNGFCLCNDFIATYRPCDYGSKFDPTLKICVQNEINCNSYQCRGLPDKTKIPALTTVTGYCECVKDVASYYNCPNGGEFNVETKKCDPPLCDFSKCNQEQDINFVEAYNTLDGYCDCSSKSYELCKEGKLFSRITGSCIEPCNSDICGFNKETLTIPSNINENSFCVCSDGNPYKTKFEECIEKSYIFNWSLGMCTPNTKELCKDVQCTSPGLTSEIKDTLTGFCVCTDVGAEPEYRDCPNGTIFVNGVCKQTAENVCNITLCADATLDHPTTFPTNDKTKEEFCYCSGPTSVMVVTCHDYEIYNPSLGLCITSTDRNMVCPDDIEIDEKIRDINSCNNYYICVDNFMELRTCPKDQYFNTEKKDCVDDKDGICNRQSKSSCLGTYYENERIKHPLNNHLYYVCKNGVLHEKACPNLKVFNPNLKQCIQQKMPFDQPIPDIRVIPAHPNIPVVPALRGKRSVDVNNDHESGCVDNDKRSVPSNCSQYEICLNKTWQLETCSNYRYYNPEQKKCLEPRDDFVCAYAKITSLPSCNNSLKHNLYPAKNCQQYYHCQVDKWRLKSCGRQKYFNAKVSSCLPIPQDISFKCDAIANKTSEVSCQHLSQRYYGKNCAMYLICLDNDWWYQYCPAGMFYNRSLNYCVPDVQNQCPDVLKSKEIQAVAEEFTQDSCQQDGLLRPSALACNRYFVCLNGKWQMQHCSAGEFYDVAYAKCSLDEEGICSNLNVDCLPHERRAVAKNCSSYEQCSQEGKWLRLSCPMGEIYDELLQQCIKNTGICSVYGLKRSCRIEETMVLSKNCSRFYYCSMDTWSLGNCLKGFMYSQEQQMCVPHDPQDKCKPLRPLAATSKEEEKEKDNQLCKDQVDGTSVPHPEDCSRYYICIQQSTSHEMQCSTGSYFEPKLGYCIPNDGSCRVPLSGPCTDASEGDLVPHPLDCQAFYKCSHLNGSQLMHCPQGQYYNNSSQQCLLDRGECKQDLTPKKKCLGLAHGTRLAHETYCNIFYACVKGLAIPVECPDQHQFNAVLGKCVYDEEHVCQDGQLVEGNVTYSCGNLTDGSYIPDRKDCTRYYICSQGQALPKKCANSTYFDSELLLCVPDDGSCPYVNDNNGEHNPVAPDPKMCEGKHGYLMVDPFNCNNFYACIHNRLKHERCYEQQFFNTTSMQCQPKPSTEMSPNDNTTTISIRMESAKSQTHQCLDENTSIKQLCSELGEGNSLAEPGDCRRYITCQEPDEDPISQRCRNGESFDSLLGFCRQNDGTCLLENGQRVGECSGKHGQLARDPNNCRYYFVCINGQKIAQTCEDDEYFSKSQNMCVKDTQNVCNPIQPPEETNKQSCAGLSESVLYPYIYDNCRSYFQCIKGEAKIHKCADELYFDPLTIKCVKNKTECVMPTTTLQRSPAFSQSYSKLCSNKKIEHPYPNLDNDCRSFYLCHANGEVSHELCPLGMMFNRELNICATDKIICT